MGETAEQTCLGNLHLYWPQLLVAMETLLHHRVGGGVLVPARGEAGIYWSQLLVTVDLLLCLVYQPQQRGPGNFALGEEAVGETAEQACLGILHLYWPQLLVAMETLVHHKVGWGVLVPACGEAGPYWSQLVMAVDLLLHLVYQPQRRGPGDFALGEEAVGETAEETCPYWSQFLVAADSLLHLVYQPQQWGHGYFAAVVGVAVATAAGEGLV